MRRPVRNPGERLSRTRQVSSKFSVELTAKVAQQVERLALGEDASISKTLAALVDEGLAARRQKQKFLTSISRNLANVNPSEEDRMVDEFRSLILGH